MTAKVKNSNKELSVRHFGVRQFLDQPTLDLNSARKNEVFRLEGSE